jgi:putative tryptophan/tyrosine transport system substrate-binding protein
MRRRGFVALLGGTAAWPFVAQAQQAGPVRLVGVLINFAENDPSAQPLLAAFRSALSKLWVDGRWQSPDRSSLGGR